MNGSLISFGLTLIAEFLKVRLDIMCCKTADCKKENMSSKQLS